MKKENQESEQDKLESNINFSEKNEENNQKEELEEDYVIIENYEKIPTILFVGNYFTK
jgi:hypothetical protein